MINTEITTTKVLLLLLTVMYRVTPVFTGNNLLCDGVQIEAYSVEDKGIGISFNVFCYNVQPGVFKTLQTFASFKRRHHCVAVY